MKHLYRSNKERMIAGVAGGLAEYFEVDVVLVRLLWVLAFFLGGGFFAYLIAWIFIPEKNSPQTQEESFDTQPETDPEIKEKRLRTGGFILIFLGLIFLFRELIPKQIFRNMLPLALIILGIIILVRSFNYQGRK